MSQNGHRFARLVFAVTLLCTACDDRGGVLSGADALSLTAAPTPAPAQTAATVATTATTAAPPATSAAGPICPVPSARFTDTWGAPRSGGRLHEGVDMLAPTGTPILAPVAGTVIHRDSSLGGRSFRLVADDGRTYFGSHLSRYGTDGRVNAGTVIGYVGDSGNATGTPHLHFEVQLPGIGAVNPTPYVRAWCG